MKKNIVANIFGRFWSLLSGFFFIPLYIKYLGFESYSVISFTLLLAGIMAILDGGLTATLSREFARKDKTNDLKRKIYKTLETCYFILVAFCVSVVCLASDLIARHLNIKEFSVQDISLFIKIVSVDIGFQLIFRFYLGGLLGLEQQVKANLYQIAWGIARNGVVVIVIIYFNSLQVFFIWQTLVTIIAALALKYTLDTTLYKKNIFSLKISFDKIIFLDVWKFAGGMMLISVVAALNTQMDKIIISKYMDINDLGYYTLAISLSTGLLVIVSPIATAILPKFTALYSEKSNEQAKQLFNRFSYIASILVFGFLANIIFFSKEILWVWTGNKELSENAYQILPVIASAYALISLQIIPYHLAIANGYTKLNNILGIISLIITLPGYLYGIVNYGAIGAAVVFMTVQFFTLFIYLFFINKKFIKENVFKNIYFKQLILPFSIAVAIGFAFHSLPINITNNRFTALIFIGLSTFFTLIVTAFFVLPKQELEIGKKLIKLIKK